jgi:glycine/D-amino acid oxidase-like deaminating enzyme
MIEHDAGYLMARRACALVVERLVAGGGAYRTAAVAAPVKTAGGRLNRLMFLDGTVLEADAFVFACGPWLPSMFPDTIGARILATRQEVHYFGTPPGDDRFTDAGLPVWIDFHDSQVYGVPGNGHRGFKVADDTSGPLMDPTTGERTATAASIERTRAFLAHRFPGLGEAPLTAAEVCQYESTPDAEFIIDWHPEMPNVWIAGGGSGHGFKMGPAVGELVASLALGDAEPDPRFALNRLAAPPPGGWQAKWV